MTSSTHNVMVLLSALMEACDNKADAGIDAKLSLQVLSDMKSEDKVAPFDLTTLSTPLPDLLTRCFAFLRHPSKVVRQSTLQTMQTLLVLLKPVEASIVKQESVTGKICTTHMSVFGMSRAQLTIMCQSRSSKQIKKGENMSIAHFISGCIDIQLWHRKSSIMSGCCTFNLFDVRGSKLMSQFSVPTELCGQIC